MRKRSEEKKKSFTACFRAYTRDQGREERKVSGITGGQGISCNDLHTLFGLPPKNPVGGYIACVMLCGYTALTLDSVFRVRRTRTGDRSFYTVSLFEKVTGF